MKSFLIKLLFIMIPVKVMTMRHCVEPKFSKSILKQGVINVAYLSEASCKNCSVQIESLSKLTDFLRGTGIDINVILSGEGNFEDVPKGFFLDDGRLWKIFKKANGHIIIFDVCGRFTYEVILPWAKLEYSFVRAAILSALVDQPCGGCRKFPLENYFQLHREEFKQEKIGIPIFPPTTKTYKLPEIVKKADDGTVPMRIIFNTNHKHTGGTKNYRAFEVVTGDADYHWHILSEEIHSETDTQENSKEKITGTGMGSATMTESKFTQSSNNSKLNEETTNNNSILLTNNSEIEKLNIQSKGSSPYAFQKQNGLEVDGGLISRDERILSEDYNMEQKLENTIDSEESQISEEDYEKHKLKAHYNNIKKWT